MVTALSLVLLMIAWLLIGRRPRRLVPVFSPAAPFAGALTGWLGRSAGIDRGLLRVSAPEGGDRPNLQAVPAGGDDPLDGDAFDLPASKQDAPSPSDDPGGDADGDADEDAETSAAGGRTLPGLPSLARIAAVARSPVAFARAQPVLAAIAAAVVLWAVASVFLLSRASSGVFDSAALEVQLTAVEEQLAAVDERIEALSVDVRALDQSVLAAVEGATAQITAAVAAGTAAGSGITFPLPGGETTPPAAGTAGTPATPGAAASPPVVANPALVTDGQNLYNCSDFTTWRDAQDVYEANLPGDPNLLDIDHNGVACELLQGAGSGAGAGEADEHADGDE